MFISKIFPSGADVAGPGPHFENHWSTVYILANSSNFLRYRNVYKIKTEKS